MTCVTIIALAANLAIVLVKGQVSLRKWLYFLLAWLVIPVWAYPFVASASDDSETIPAPPILDVTDVEGHQSLVSYFTYLHDPTAQLTLAEVASSPYAEQFTLAEDRIPNLGTVEGAVWIRMALANPASTPASVILDLDLPTAETIDLFAADPSSGATLLVATGAGRPYADRPLPGRSFALPLQLPAASVTTYFMRVAAVWSMRLNLTLWQPAAFARNALRDEVIWGIVLGMLIIMATYNLLVFLVLRDAKHLLLSAFVMSVALSSALSSGYASRWLDPQLSSLFLQLLTISIALVIALFIFLAIVFLELRTRVRWAYWLLVGAMAVSGLATLAALGGFSRFAYALPLIVLVPALITIYAATIIVVRQGLRMAVFFLIGQTVPIVMGIFQTFSLLGGLPWVPAYQLIVATDNLVLPVLMSLALADRINILRKEANEANAALMVSQQQLTSYLDALPFAIQVHDAALKLIFINRAIRQTITDVPAGWFEEDYSTWERARPAMISGTDQLYPVEQLPLMRAAQGERVHAEDVAVESGGRQVPLEIWSVPICDQQGSVTAIITAFQDISQRRAVENELAAYRSELEQRVAQRTAELGALNASLGARVAELSAINDISRSMALVSDQELNLQKVVRILVELYDVASAGIVFFDDAHRAVRLVVAEDRGALPLRDYVYAYLPYDHHAQPNFLRLGPVIVDDLGRLTHFPDDVAQELRAGGVTQLLVAPIIARDEELGAIVLVSDDPARRFSPDELRVAQTVAGQVAAAIDTTRLLEEARRQRDVADALRRTTAALSRSLDQQNVLGTILEQLYQVIAYEGAAVALVDGAALVIVDAKGLSARDLARRAPLDGCSPSLTVLQTGKPLLIQETRTWAGWAAWNSMPMVRSWLGVPLVSSQGIIGVLNLDSTVPRAFVQSQADLLMAFADQAAIAVMNARLYAQAQDAAAANERQRLARDLHDAVTQTIFSASLVAASLPARLNGMSHEAQTDVQMLQLLTRGALAEMRTLLLELRPEHLRLARLDLLLRQLAEAFTGRTGVAAAVTANCDPTFEVSYPVKLAAYRIVQEALSNVAKHAQALHVTINCTLRPHILRVAVIDDGRGFQPAVTAPENLGLAIMAERAAEIGAELIIDSAPGLGTHLFLTWSEASDPNEP